MSDEPLRVEAAIVPASCWFCGKDVADYDTLAVTDLTITLPIGGTLQGVANRATRDYRFDELPHPFGGKGVAHWCAIFHSGCFGRWITVEQTRPL